ncbi:PREDICTED: pollen receptor-like kinase 3 [Ipomoea nil]|uniref:pollen receptor-like kinase 3 n=1 Tax=Ipomoea nil TaxID=35883 RepID=UPI0009012DB1|nr:PREDICTED: pollen receptor-like kinase 3 [Ipomoea nil]
MAAVRRIPTFPLIFFSFCLILQCLPLSISVGDDVVLIEFKESLQNTKGLDDTWVKGKSPCDKTRRWFGVLCHRKTVTGLRLYNMGLAGDIDVDALSNLQGLRMIALANNSFSGPIPDFDKLRHLKSLFIQGNRFSGEISADYFAKMTGLRKLWLSHNGFSGNIPASLGKLPRLVELHLEGNGFSSAVPPLAQRSLTILDLSGNKLQGEIPSGMARFGAKAFEGNPELCGEPVGRQCREDLGKDGGGGAEAQTPENAQRHSSGMRWLLLSIVAGLLLVAILFNKNQNEENVKTRRKDNLDEVLVVQIASMARSESINHSSRRSTSTEGSSSRGGDFVLVNEERGMFGLSELMMASAEVLGNGGLGSAYKAALPVIGLTVVVKRLKETNKMNKDAFDAEMRKMGMLRHHNILPLLAYHYRKQEKLVVSEFGPKGSLLYLLHGDRGTAHNDLKAATRIKIIKGVASGMEYLHTEFATYKLPHGNLKSSNILLTPTYEPLLTDYAFHPLVSGTPTLQCMFALKAPEGHQISHKSDVYCLGIVILEVVTGKFPSQYLSNQKGGTDVVQWVRQAVADGKESEVIDPEIAGAGEDSDGKMVKLLQIGAACTESDVEKRLSMKEAIKRIREIQDVEVFHELPFPDEIREAE